MSRFCSSCGIEETENIVFKKRTSCCTPCYRIKQKRWNSRYYKENKNKIIENERKKYHQNREEINEKRRIKRRENKELYAEKRKKYYEKNKERKKQYAREYAKRPYVKEKIREARRRYYKSVNGKNAINNSIIKRKLDKEKVFEISQKDLKRVYKLNCINCGSKEITLDHIIPISRGGRHSIGNLQPLCRSCNASKGTMFMVEWKQELQRRRSLNVSFKN